MTHNDTPSRRTALKTISAGLTGAIAGCFGDDSSDDDTTDGSGNDGTIESNPVFDAITMAGLRFEFELQSDTDVSMVNVLTSDGELTGQTRVETGVTTGSVGIGSSYTPGTFEFLALDGSESEITSVERTFEPSVGIGSTALATGNSEFVDQYSTYRPGHISFDLWNEGNGSVVFDRLIIDTPLADSNRDNWENTAPAYVTTEDGQQVVEHAGGPLVIGPDERYRVATAHEGRDGKGELYHYCDQSDWGTETSVTVLLETRGGQTFERTYDGEIAQYRRSGQECTVRFPDGESDADGTTTDGGE